MRKNLLFLFCCCAFQLAAQKATDTRVFEMRIYYAEPGKLDALVQRFQQHTRALFEKHGMENIVYFLPTGNEKNQLIYVLAYPDMDARNASWKAFGADPAWVTAKSNSEVNGKLVNRVESVFMTATDFSPTIKAIKKGRRVFELRTYTAMPGKLDDLKARFRQHTMSIFKRLGSKNVAYWTTIEQDKTQPKLIYILSHKNEAAGKKMIENLLKDPEWIKVSTDSERNGSLVQDIGSVFMTVMPNAKK